MVDYGDVEHFRPKSKYWWLAYCLDNYLVSCAICNQKFKSNVFPILNDKLKSPIVRASHSNAKLDEIAKSMVPDPLKPDAVQEFMLLHESEATLLVNPYIDDPADYFAWHADMTIEEVELVPGDGSNVANECVVAAKEVYGLDRSQLRRSRYHTFDSYLTKKLTLEDSGISANTRNINQNSLNRMTRATHPYAGMIRFFEDLGTPEDWIQLGHLTI